MFIVCCLYICWRPWNILVKFWWRRFENCHFCMSRVESLNWKIYIFLITYISEFLLEYSGIKKIMAEHQEVCFEFWISFCNRVFEVDKIINDCALQKARKIYFIFSINFIREGIFITFGPGPIKHQDRQWVYEHIN